MSEPAAAWPILNMLECRLLGVLVEKAKTTPDVYPMSLNSLMSGCNQKSNRDPVMNVDETDIEETLDGLQAKGLVIKVTGGRVDRWRQALYDVWLVSKVDLAVLAELLLRGPQTEGELRSRAARMEPIDDLEQLRSILKPLSERKLVVYLTRERSRGTMLTHGFESPEEINRLRALHSSGVSAEEVHAPPRASQGPAWVQPAAPSEIAQLRAEVQELRTELARVAATVSQLQQALGG